MKIRFLVVVPILLCFFSCRKKTVEVEKDVNVYIHDTLKYAWNAEPVNGAISNLYFTNSISWQGFTSFMNETGFHMVYDSIRRNWSFGPADNYIPFNFSCPAKSFVCKKFHLFLGSDAISIEDPFAGNSSMAALKDILCKNLDTSFKSFSFIYTNSSVVYSACANDSNRIVVPVNTSDGANNVFYLMDLKTNYYPPPNQLQVSSYDTSHFRKIKIPLTTAPWPHQGVCGNIKNNLFVSCNDTTYIIRPDYSYQAVSPYFLYSFFTVNNNYYALGINNGSRIYQTTDLGETWTDAVTLNSQYNFLSFYNFDNKLIAVGGSQIWEVNFQPNVSITFKEINNSGLENKVVSSLSKCDGKVFITTNAGIYSRAYKDFYQYK